MELKFPDDFVLMFNETDKKQMTRELLGGKGLGLAEMTRMGLPVKPGFTITSKTINDYLFSYGDRRNHILRIIKKKIARLEKITHKKFNMDFEIKKSSRLPDELRFSARSSPLISMPGQLVTALDINHFQELLDQLSRIRFSWHNDLAKFYRNIFNIPDYGLAINVQEMAYGDLNDRSGSGVAFSHDLQSGEKGLCGEFDIKKRGDQIVGGRGLSHPLMEIKNWQPGLYDLLDAIVDRLYRHYQDIVDVEFTIEDGKLFMFQVRTAKRTDEAGLRFAISQFETGQWDKRKAVKTAMIAWPRLNNAKRFSDRDWQKAKKNQAIIAGLPITAKCAVGPAVFSRPKLKAMIAQGLKPIFFNRVIMPEDYQLVRQSAGIVSAEGGSSSHFALLARELNKPAIAGCLGKTYLTVSDKGWQIEPELGRINNCDIVSLNGKNGEIILGEVPLRNSSATYLKSRAVKILGLKPPKRIKVKEIPLRRKPVKIDFSHCKKTYCIYSLIGSFYLCEKMADEFRETPLAAQAANLFREVTLKSADVLLCYLTLAIAGELRHGRNYIIRNRLYVSRYTKQRIERDLRRLEKRYQIIENYHDDNRDVVQCRAINIINRHGYDEQVKFFKLAIKLFGDSWSSDNMGGKKWQNIAQVALNYLQGKMTHVSFVDQVVHLKHNSNLALDKNIMLDYHNHDKCYLESLVDAKSTASNLIDLMRIIKLCNRSDNYQSAHKRAHKLYWHRAETLFRAGQALKTANGELL